ncbi:MAG: bacterial Ig-like domain-containing protein, partial [Firmicutes bacterium]|nr:bacterial Ig-like domain-containing protein [Bacillota bacterium]
MKERNISYFKKALVVFMAIVMVFTYMPSGMGVETAWADTATTVINTATEFADMDSSGNYVLGGNITISQPYGKEFSGTFDGKGYTVELNITGTEANTGLFSTLVGGATVKNVITAGSIEASDCNNVGGIAGKADTSNGSITIEKCKNTADISGYEAVGGILGFGYSYEGSNSVTIEECANIGNITGSNNKIGGIAGNLENSHAIRNCYNTGDIIGFNNYAGIIGRGAKGISVENCYTTGTITAYGSSTNAGYAIMGGTGSGTKCTVSNSYAVKGCATELCYSSSRYSVDIDTVSNFKESESMKEKAFATALGEKFRHNEGTYPTLEWEISTAKVPFNITPANAQLTITKTSAADEGSVVYTGTGGTIALPVGDYSYTVSCEGYTPETGSVSVTDGSGTLTASPNSVSRSLDKDTDKWGTVTFAVSGANNYEIKLTQNGVEVQPTSEKNKYELLINKEYSYVVSSSETGVEQAEGSIILTEGAKTKTEVVRLKKVVSIKVKTQPEKTQYYVGDKTIDTTGLVITVAYNDNSSADITSGFETSGLNTETVCASQDITVSYKGATAKYQISIKEKAFPSSVFNALAGKAEVKYISSDETKVLSNDIFVDATKLEAGCLKSNIVGKKNMSATVQIDFSKLDRAYELSFNYILSAEGSSYDYIKINNEKIGTTNHTEWKTYVLQVKKGDKVEITYRKDSSGDKLDDCIYLKDFKLKSIPQVTFNTVPADALVSMKAADGSEAAASESSDGKTIFAVQNGTYTYTVSAFGYKSETGTITVSSEDIAKDITLTKLVSRKATFNVTLPDDLEGKEDEISITVKSGETIVKPEADGTYSLPQGEEYTYTITHPNCESAQGSFTIAAEDVTETIQMIRKLVFSDVFAAMSGIEAVNNTDADKATEYGFFPVKTRENIILQSNNKGKGYSIAAMKITAKTAQKLSFSYKVSTEQSYDKFLILLNGTEEINESGKIDWTDYNIKLSANDSVVLKYTKDSSGNRNDDTVYLKDFSAENLYKFTFTGAPTGTTFVVKQGETVIEAEADGSYLLANGSYTYTGSAFGYEDANGSFTVNGGDVSETVSMNKTAAYTVSFKITKPSGITAEAAVAVKSGNTIIAAAEDGKYNLPAGTYSYTVTCTGCETETGEFTVGTEAKTVEVTLEKTLTFEDFFTELNGRATVANSTYYKFKPAKEGAIKYLQSSNTSDGTTGIITFTFQKSTKLNFKYMVSEEGSKLTGSEYGLIIKRNSQKIARIEEVSENWKDYSVLAKAGDVITLTYKCYVNDYAMSKDDKDFVRLRDFTAVPLTEVSFEGMPKNAMISVKNGDNVIAPVDGSYLLEAGNYSYSVTAFGYMPTTNQALTIAGEEETRTVTVSMTETARHAVSFQVTPSGAAIVVKNEAGETMSALDGNASSYSLPANEKYSYEVSADG